MPTLPANTVPNDLASIDANRSGQITPWQRQQLIPSQVLGSLIAAALSAAVAIAGICGFLIFPLWAVLRNNTSGTQPLSLPLSLIDLLFLGVSLGITSPLSVDRVTTAADPYHRPSAI